MQDRRTEEKKAKVFLIRFSGNFNSSCVSSMAPVPNGHGFVFCWAILALGLVTLASPLISAA